jgi:hypothetical protein
MTCPICQAETGVVTCRAEGHQVHRLRECAAGHRFYTCELPAKGRYPWPKKPAPKRPKPKPKQQSTHWLARIAAFVSA